MKNEKQIQKEQSQPEEKILTVEELDQINGGLVPFPRIHYFVVADGQTDKQLRKTSQNDLLRG
jgi:hypothetical protein